jgi:hypothetical protein
LAGGLGAELGWHFRCGVYMGRQGVNSLSP